MKIYLLVSFFSLARCSNSQQLVSGVFNLVMKIQDSVEDRAGEVAELTMGHFWVSEALSPYIARLHGLIDSNMQGAGVL